MLVRNWVVGIPDMLVGTWIVIAQMGGHSLCMTMKAQLTSPPNAG